MNTMKAVRLFEFGGPEKLVYDDYPLPDVGPTDVLVKVLATSVSRWDIKYRTGEVHEFYGKSTGHHGGIQGRRAFPMPMQLGRAAAGEVVRCPKRRGRTPCSKAVRTSWDASSCIPGTMFEACRRGAALQRSKVGGDTPDLPVPVTDGIGFTAAT
jgi:NADPH:quinone reductase-like Zn-dependent oxidoreductase